MHKHFFTFLCVIFFSTNFSFGQKDKSYIASDIATISPAPYDYSGNAKYKSVEIKNLYVTMRDGVKIAVDVYLPKGLEEGVRIPALLHQTRYWRSPDLRWPFSMFTNGLIGPMGKAITSMVTNGYAVVNVDARGSGASFGNRPFPWSENETIDGAEIVDWIIEQDWSNQEVGAIGVSYSATTSEFLLVNNHPNVKAAILLYGLFDVYDDIAFPGGIYHKFFVENWGKFNGKLDENKYPRKSFVAKLLVKGVRRVNGKKKVRTFREAIKDHEANLQVSETSDGIVYRDDEPKNKGVKSSEVFSPYSYINEINESGAAIYCYSGWLDGDYQHAAIRKYLNYNNPQNKLLLGPWEHGGSYNCSPANPGKAGFDHVGEFLKFFDFHLKGMDNGLYDEPKVHYFTMGEDTWKSAENWPPLAETQTFYFSEDNSLSKLASKNSDAFDAYQVDTTSGTGDDSRWKSVIGMLKTGAVYPDRKEQGKKLLVYESPVLDNDMEVSGHPIVTLYLTSTASDGNFHVYLEEVDSEGNIHLITEGLLRGIHRKISEEEQPYKDIVPYHSYLKRDSTPLIPGEIAELKFDLLPVSYLFEKGSRLRIALAGADIDHFSTVVKEEPLWNVFRSESYPSNVEIPVVVP